MTPAASASSCLGVDVVHDVIIVRFAGNDYRVDTARHVVEFEHMARLPRDVVIGARIIAGNPKTANDPTVGSVKRKATAKDVNTAGAAADQKVTGGAILFGITAVHRSCAWVQCFKPRNGVAVTSLAGNPAAVTRPIIVA